jgi:hypothetical protein
MKQQDLNSKGQNLRVIGDLLNLDMIKNLQECKEYSQAQKPKFRAM